MNHFVLPELRSDLGALAAQYLPVSTVEWRRNPKMTWLDYEILTPDRVKCGGRVRERFTAHC